jgi:hypothetical protein
MGSSPDDFLALQALLKLKRHEQPPPRYFNDLPHGIMGRLRGPEGLRHTSLFSLLGLEFGLRSVLFQGLGVGCCVAAMAGAAYLMVRTPPPTYTLNPVPSAASLPEALKACALVAPVPPLSPDERSPVGGSTNPIFNPGNVTFPEVGFTLRASPAKFDLRP